MTVQLKAVEDDKASLQQALKSEIELRIQLEGAVWCMYNCIFMVALCNRETIYIFMLWFVLLSFFFPRLISAVTDWMSAILPHMVWP